MNSREIRQSFLDFFASKEHRIVRSAPVIPAEDPTLLFTNAGMNQFKDVFLGKGSREYVRAADTQKCIRASGKHNDLEDVGRDTYHHTFFEMLGNWSFGDYYKAEAIGWAWELLTSVWKLPKDRLYATVYHDDEESLELWKKETDIDPTHILKFGDKDNFWEMGETGPCGPCSEIHIDLTPDASGGPLVNAGDYRVIELWNLVFIQYNRQSDGSLEPLPQKHVDTGMGFERVTAVMQGKGSNYDSDVFTPLFDRITELTGVAYTASLDSPTDIAMRVIADHSRTLTFALSDGAVPGNEGRGYVLRRILRRAVRYAGTLGCHEPIMYRMVGVLADTMGDVFPELHKQRPTVEKIIRAEEESFLVTLGRGTEIFNEVVAGMKSAGTTVISGADAFRLYDTFGFPLDLTRLMAAEVGFDVDEQGFEHAMQEQKARARMDRKDKMRA
ncbi:MAG: alanine--tRNA ligase, partial [Chlorobiaceae bacterium]|nr:alanine--tRNA ligase [Chlorobiaceae bacterium]